MHGDIVRKHLPTRSAIAEITAPMIPFRVLFLGYDETPEKRADEFFKLVSLTEIRSIEDFLKKPTKPKEKYTSTSHPTSAFREDKQEIELVSINYFLSPPIPTLYDHHVVLVSADVQRLLRPELEKRGSEIQSLVSAPFGGVIIVPFLKDGLYDKWMPVAPSRIKSLGGEEIMFNEKHWLYHLLAKYKSSFKWQAHEDSLWASYPESRKDVVLATNIADNPIAWDFPIGNGKIIYLPFFEFNTIEQESLFLRELLDRLRGQTKLKETRSIPLWASKPEYSFDKETLIDMEVQKLEDERRAIAQAKSILWLDGAELSKALTSVLSQMGVKCIYTEEQGRHDLEITETELHAVLEVKGHSKYVDVQDLRQLRDWYDEKLKEDESLKGVFVVNHFKEIEPALRGFETRKVMRDRDTPYTKEAERIAKNNDFCLATTMQIFELFKRRLKGEYSKTLFLKSLKDTKGLLQLQSISD